MAKFAGSLSMMKFLMATSAFALMATPALAQDAAPAEDEAIAEIIVTAQKRSERLQDVPVAVSVVSGAALETQGGVNIENAQYLVPTLNFRKSGTTINQSLFLRGVGTSTFSIAGEPSVSTVLDGVVYSRAGEAFGDLVDIERLEVLRGPQGTLFGKNASAGVVNIVSKRPTDDFEGSLEASFFTKSEYRGRGIINLPIGEKARGRFTGFYGQYDGNIRNINPAVNDRVNGYKHYGFRGIVELDLSEKVKATIIGDYRKSDDDCCGEVIGTAPGAINTFTAGPNPTPILALSAATVQGALSGTQFAGDKSRTIRQNLVTATIEESYGGSLQLDAELGSQTITSITSYREYDNREIRDGDFIDTALIGLNQLHDDGPQTSQTFTQELRLTSPGKQFVDYVLGAFYSRAETERTFTRNDIVCTPATTPVTTLVPCGAAGANPSTFPTGTANFGSVFKNFALFGQGTLNLAERFRFIGGLRYTIDQLDVFHSRVSPLTGPGIQPNFDAGVFNNGLRNPVTGSFVAGISNGIPFTAKATNTNLSGKAGAQFDVSDDSKLYATYSRGYKGPAFNIFFNLTTIGTLPIEPETADSYEVGLKNSLFNGRLIVNLAAYYAKYKNFQANNPDLVAGVRTTRFTNAGTISTRGAELDFVAKPVKNLTISGGLAYTDAKVDRFRLPPGADATQLIPNGTPLAYAPKFKGSVGADYLVETGGSVNIILGAQSSFQTKQLSLFLPSAAARAAGTIGGYSLVDLSASIVDVNDRYKLTLQAKNVFDTSFASSIVDGGPGGSFRYLIPREADRYFGITARVNFGAK
jgi:iron complex outermembrane recepter protein